MTRVTDRNKVTIYEEDGCGLYAFLPTDFEKWPQTYRLWAGILNAAADAIEKHPDPQPFWTLVDWMVMV